VGVKSLTRTWPVGSERDLRSPGRRRWPFSLRGTTPPTAATERGLSAQLKTSSRLALLVFVAVELAMLIAVLVMGQHKWFVLDDWPFLTARKVGSLNSLFRPANGHWSTVPVVVFRGLYAVFGLRTYLPYEAVVLILHLTAGALLRTLMRRLGVGAWIATVAASLFVLFGAGYENIIWATQIGFVGSLVFGLTQLLLAGHDGPLSRRDSLGLLAGVVGLMCSGLAVAMTVVVGLVALARRGWRPALFHTAPLAALYVAWWLGFGSHYYKGHGVVGSLGSLANWVETGFVASFNAMGQVPGVGIVLAAVLVVGLVLAWHGLDRRMLSVRAAPPAALLVGAFLFIVMAGWQREVLQQFKLSGARDGRYMDILVAMMLPAIAVAADAIVRRWRETTPVVVGALVIGIPGNLQVLSNPTGLYSTRLENTYRQDVLSLVDAPVAHAVPRSLQGPNLRGVFPPTWPPPQGATIGWLLDQQSAGRLPNPGRLSPTQKANATITLALHQSNGPSGEGTRASATALAGQPAGAFAPAPLTPASTLVNRAENQQLGPILVDNQGMTLYTLVNGIQPVPCTGACGIGWSPLVAPGTSSPTGGSGVSGLGKTKPGGVVTYWGYPLALFSGDKTPGETNGNDVKGSGGVWHVVRLPGTCRPLDAPVTAHLEQGQSIGIRGGVVEAILLIPGGDSDPITFDPANGNTLAASAGPLTVQLMAARGQPELCM
jgi:predicted lipoprotein with Yx(FWY)xxD motif